MTDTSSLSTDALAAPVAPGGSPLLTLDDVRAARERIGDAILHTPTTISRTLSAMVGANVFLKFENLQFTAAYKERGALLGEPLRQKELLSTHKRVASN